MAVGPSQNSDVVEAGLVLGDRADTLTAQTLIVHDTWSGMSEESPLVTIFELRRTEQGSLTGSVKHSRRGQLQYTREIDLSRAMTTRLLRLLKMAPLTAEPYEPHFDHTDDFPRIEIVIVLEPAPSMISGAGMLLLASSSQGEFHAPWSVGAENSTWTSHGEHIGRALAMLRRANKQK